MKDKTFQKYKKYILHFVNKKYKNLRKRKYNFDYYIKNFIHVLTDVTKWQSLNLINNNERTFHWKTIYNEYNKWCKDNIFEDAYKNFIGEHYFKMSKLKNNKIINLFIDVTKINNKYGSEKIGINVEYKKKNITALTVICDINKIPLGFTYVNTNNRKNNKNSLQHEIKNVQNTLDTISVNFKRKKINLIGDKGYISRNKFKLGKKMLPIITPKRINQKIQATSQEKILLKDRYKIENLFAILKNSNRINVRKDKNIKNYMGFVHLSFLQYLFNYNDKHENTPIIFPA
jgi:hypothetical protein